MTEEKTTYLADPAVLALFFDEGKLQLPPRHLFIVPEIVRALARKAANDPSSRRDLVRLISAFDPQFAKKRIHQYNWELFFSRLEASKEIGVDFFPEEFADPEISKAVEAVFYNDPELSNFDVILSPRRNLLGAVFGALMGASKRRGLAILFKSMKWLKYAQDRLPVVLLAVKNRAQAVIQGTAQHSKHTATELDLLMQRKQAWTQAKLKYPGMKTGKVFLGIAVSVGGLATGHLALSIAGVALAVIDP